MIGIRMEPKDAQRLYWCEQERHGEACRLCGSAQLMPSRWEICLTCYEKLTGCHDGDTPEPQQW
jgi:hypothetical protein